MFLLKGKDLRAILIPVPRIRPISGLIECRLRRREFGGLAPIRKIQVIDFRGVGTISNRGCGD